MTEMEYRTQLVELGASLFARGYSVGSAGNISLRLPDGNIMATPTNSCLGRLSVHDLSVTDTNGKHLGGLAPTKELFLHLAVYQAGPDRNAVVHLHSSYATALAALADMDPENALMPFTPYYVMKIGPTRRHHRADQRFCRGILSHGILPVRTVSHRRLRSAQK